MACFFCYSDWYCCNDSRMLVFGFVMVFLANFWKWETYKKKRLEGAQNRHYTYKMVSSQSESAEIKNSMIFADKRRCTLTHLRQ